MYSIFIKLSSRVFFSLEYIVCRFDHDWKIPNIRFSYLFLRFTVRLNWSGNSVSRLKQLSSLFHEQALYDPSLNSAYILLVKGMLVPWCIARLNESLHLLHNKSSSLGSGGDKLNDGVYSIASFLYKNEQIYVS